MEQIVVPENRKALLRRRIIFVDDDVNVLNSLKRSLHNFREFEIIFVSQASKALELVRQNCFDAVISDMRMPDMDGATLLREVKRICPTTIRFILSGQADKNVILNSIDCIHQYFAKPCDPVEILRQVQKILAAITPGRSESYNKLCNTISAFPSASDSFIEWSKELAGETPSIETLGDIASKDIAISLKLLQLVNTFFFGDFGPVFDPKEAVRLLGIDILTELHSKNGVLIGGIDRTALVPITELNRAARKYATILTDQQKHKGICTAQQIDTFYYCNLMLGVGPIVASQYGPELVPFVDPGMFSDEQTYPLMVDSTKQLSNYLLQLWGIPVVLGSSGGHPEGISWEVDNE